VLPRNSQVTSGFGDGRVFNGRLASRHLGLDLRGFTGDTVVAAARGVVAITERFLLAGNVVYLNHGAGVLSAYFHLSEQLVEVGDTVEAGDPVGRVGATGRVTGPHLHWVVRYGRTSVDPRSLVEATESR
jgi:murein DD-endopeptidase MepM/ murein hydrolase activator NlpD